jgi:hypothetical protein
MIAIEETDNLINIAVFGEFTLSDYQEFEDQVIAKSRSLRKMNCRMGRHQVHTGARQ